MNWAEIMLRGVKAVSGKLGKDLLIWGLLIGSSSLAIHSCNKARVAGREAAIANERAALREAQVDTFEASNESLKRDLRGAKEESAVLRATLEDAERRIKAATGKKPEVIEVIQWVTVPGHAGGEAPPGREALVSRGDTLAIRGTSLKLETKAGNHVVTGAASCWRLEPKPETKLYEGPIDMGSVKAVEKPVATPAAPRRWAAGPVGTIDMQGNYAIGPQIGYRIWRVDLALGMTFPDQRTVSSVLVRW